MKAILLILALSACSTPVHTCVQRLGPDPLDTQHPESGVLGGILANMLHGDDPDHVEWQKKFDACVQEEEAKR